MRIKLTRGCMVPGRPDVKPGDVFDVADDIGRALVAINKAEVVTVAPAPTVARIEVREPEVETRDPEPVKVTKRSRSKLA